MTIKVFDPHIHLFDLALGQYEWLRAEQAPHWPDKYRICRDFSEQDLILTGRAGGSQDMELAGFVHIEAGFDNNQPWREIEWLENTCSLSFRSIASIDLTLPTNQFLEQILKLKTFDSVVGVRHILDDQVISILGSEYAIKNLQCLAKHQLLFELQTEFTDSTSIARHLHSLITCIDNDKANGNRLKVIINHAGFPPLDGNHTDSKQMLNNWLASMTALSKNPNVYIKCSGWEMTNRHYTKAQVGSILRELIKLFGINRVMLASNFPLCTFSLSYNEYWQNMVTLASDLTNELTNEHSEPLNQQASLQARKLYLDNAIAIYGL